MSDIKPDTMGKRLEKRTLNNLGEKAIGLKKREPQLEQNLLWE